MNETPLMISLMDDSGHIYMIDSSSFLSRFHCDYTQHLRFRRQSELRWLVAWFWLLTTFRYFGDDVFAQHVRVDRFLPLLESRTFIAPSPGKGYGLYATAFMHVGECVGEYTGLVELLSVCESNHQAEYRTQYPMFSLSGRRWSVNAAREGNMTRFVNHSNKPNTEMKAFYDGRFMRLALVVTEVIKPGQEILLDYGHDYWAARDDEPV